MRRSMRAAAVVVLLALCLTGWSTPAAADPVADEQAFVSHINGLRAANGLPALQVDVELTTIARRFAAEMAAAGRIWHNPAFSASVTQNWRKVGENVGVGPTVDSLHQAFVDSPAHLENLVDGEFTRVGVGVVHGGDGRIYTAHQFMQLFPAPAPAPPPPAPAPAASPPPPPAPVSAPSAASAPGAPATVGPPVTSAPASPEPVASIPVEGATAPAPAHRPAPAVVADPVHGARAGVLTGLRVLTGGS